MSKKSCPILYSKILYKMDQDFWTDSTNTLKMDTLQFELSRVLTPLLYTRGRPVRSKLTVSKLDFPVKRNLVRFYAVKSDGNFPDRTRIVQSPDIRSKPSIIQYPLNIFYILISGTILCQKIRRKLTISDPDSSGYPAQPKYLQHFSEKQKFNISDNSSV